MLNRPTKWQYMWNKFIRSIIKNFIKVWHFQALVELVHASNLKPKSICVLPNIGVTSHTSEQKYWRDNVLDKNRFMVKISKLFCLLNWGFYARKHPKHMFKLIAKTIMFLLSKSLLNGTFVYLQDENKEIALGTSKLNYLDPRISVAW